MGVLEFGHWPVSLYLRVDEYLEYHVTSSIHVHVFVLALLQQHLYHRSCFALKEPWLGPGLRPLGGMVKDLLQPRILA